MLSKILPVFVLPTGLSIILITVGLAFRKRALAWAGLVLLWLGSTPLVGDAVMRAVEGGQVRIAAEAAPRGRAVVVLSGNMIRTPPGDAPPGEWTDAVDRFEAGVALLQADKAPLLVFTGGWMPWRPDDRPEGDVLAQRAAALGVPPERIRVTGKVSNTAAEARAVARLLQDLPAHSPDDPVLLVTSAFHMRRARMLFERRGVAVHPFPVDFQVGADRPLTILDLLPSANGLRQTETSLREAWGFLFYRVWDRG